MAPRPHPVQTSRSRVGGGVQDGPHPIQPRRRLANTDMADARDGFHSLSGRSR